MQKGFGLGWSSIGKKDLNLHEVDDLEPLPLEDVVKWSLLSLSYGVGEQH